MNTQDKGYKAFLNLSESSKTPTPVSIDKEVLEAENKQLRERVKYLEDLIVEYTGKMKVNLSGGKVDSFLKDQVKEYNWSAIEKEITDEMEQYHEIKNRNEKDDISDVL